MEETRRVSERMRAIEILVEMYGGLDSITAMKLSTAGPPLVRARTAWAIGRTNPAAPELESLKKLLTDRDPVVQRFALEALTSVTSAATFNKVLNEIAHALASDDRHIRYSAAVLLTRLNDEQRDALAESTGCAPHRPLVVFTGSTDANDNAQPIVCGSCCQHYRVRQAANRTAA
jgi:hypothetical protein